MNRRSFITLFGGAVAAGPVAVHAQHPQKMPLIGTLMPSPVEVSTSLDAFLQGLRDLGYIEGQNIAIERRFADWKLDRLPVLGGVALWPFRARAQACSWAPTAVRPDPAVRSRANCRIPVCDRRKSPPVDSRCGYWVHSSSGPQHRRTRAKNRA
jgi:hypothetical protein